MNHLRLRLSCGVFLTGLAATTSIAPAADRGAWFKSLTQPDTGLSCCDISDCRRADADWKGGQWWAVVEGQWTAIPHEKELSKQSIDGDAYVCATPSRHIYCFVKPAMAM